MQSFLRAARACLFLCLCAPAMLRAQNAAPSIVSGSVLDPSGAAIPGADLLFHNADGNHHAKTDGVGHYTTTLAPGSYDLHVQAGGFRVFTRAGVVINPARNTPLNVTLEISSAEEEVNVPSEDGANSTDADANKSALIFKNEKLDTFSDDPSIMQQQLQAIAGTDPSNPPQLYVDGFSNGTMPPKEAIREIRINQNPFTTQYDQFGFGRIEIFTKPGATKLHGNVNFNYNPSFLNGRNPYSPATPSYWNEFSYAGINGPIGKKSTFYFNYSNNHLAQNEVINATKLDANLNQVNVSESLPNNVTGQTYSIRFDRQFGKNDTFIGRYTFSDNVVPNGGAGLLVLSEQRFSSTTHSQTVQFSDTHLFGPHVVLDAALQYVRTHQLEDAFSAAPSLTVQGYFTGGGSSAQALHDHTDRLELQQYFSISYGKHFIRTGLRYRMTRDANLSASGFNGAFVFPDIATYRQTLLNIQYNLANPQQTPIDIRANGGGPSQFSISTGQASAELLTGDVGVYAEDEWKATPNLTLNYGLRVESQSAIPDHFDPAPRGGFAYAIKPGKAKSPLLTLRGGFGLFYQRFAAGNILNSLRENGTAQQVKYVTNPDFYCDPSFNPPCTAQDLLSMPALTSVPSTVYRINPRLRSPMTMQSLVTAERSLGKYGSLAVNYFAGHRIHQLESLNLNAPEPGTYDPANPTSGVRPFGGTQNIDEYSSDGVSNGWTLSTNANLNFGKHLSAWQGTSFGHQTSNTSGGFASNSYNLNADEGRASGYPSRQVYAGIFASGKWDTSISTFFAARSQTNFNITTGTDNNGDSFYNDRPAFATDLSRASVVRTAYGNFDTNPLPGQTIIPINYGNAPALVYLEVYASKGFHFGPRPPMPTPPAGALAPKPGVKPDLPPQRYHMQFSVGADNIFNHPNAGTPVGVLTSPFFGKSISLNAPFNNNNAANRTIMLRGSLSF